LGYQIISLHSLEKYIKTHTDISTLLFSKIINEKTPISAVKITAIS
jgi:hypothetical protein